MKRYSYFLLLIVLFSSCNKWLDVKPKDQLDKDDLFRNEQGFSDALAGIYGGLTQAPLYGRELTYGMLDVMSGYYTSYYGGRYEPFANYAYKRDNPARNVDCIAAIDLVWTGLYSQVANLNALLENIDTHKQVFTGGNYQLIKGEALGLRAFLHFELLRMYGTNYETGKDKKFIPFVDKLKPAITPLSTTQEVIGRIVSDLDTAITLMPADPIVTGVRPSPILSSATDNLSGYGIPVWHNRRFRFNYYAAKATQARAYLWMNNKPKALEAALSVIADQATRFPWVKSQNLSNIGNATAENQDRSFVTEQIFALNVPRIDQLTEGHLWFSSGSVTGVLGNYDFNVQAIYESYTTDPRLQYLFTPYQFYSISTKYAKTSAVNAAFRDRIPLIRISEMFYIAAECSPNVADGVALLDKVRANRGLLSAPLDPGMSATSLADEIYKEYRKEFYGEGQLWYYYKRLNYTSIPDMWNFSGTELYQFDRPENEDQFGNR